MFKIIKIVLQQNFTICQKVYYDDTNKFRIILIQKEEKMMVKIKNNKAQFFSLVDIWAIVFYVTALIAIFLIITFTVKNNETEIEKNIKLTNLPHSIINFIEVKDIRVWFCNDMTNYSKSFTMKTMSLVELSQIYEHFANTIGIANIDADCMTFLDDAFQTKMEETKDILKNDVVVNKIIIESSTILKEAKSSDSINCDSAQSALNIVPLFKMSYCDNYEFLIPSPYSEIKINLEYYGKGVIKIKGIK